MVMKCYETSHIYNKIIDTYGYIDTLHRGIAIPYDLNDHDHQANVRIHRELSCYTTSCLYILVVDRNRDTHARHRALLKDNLNCYCSSCTTITYIYIHTPPILHANITHTYIHIYIYTYTCYLRIQTCTGTENPQEQSDSKRFTQEEQVLVQGQVGEVLFLRRVVLQTTPTIQISKRLNTLILYGNCIAVWQ